LLHPCSVRRGRETADRAPVLDVTRLGPGRDRGIICRHKADDLDGAVALDVTYPHLEKPDAEPARLQRLPRVRVAQIVMDYLAHGWSPDEMCRQHPYLRPAEAHAAMTYYFDHQDEIDHEIRTEWQQAQRDQTLAPSTPFVVRLRAKGLL
jgi:hypothetical protein